MSTAYRESEPKMKSEESDGLSADSQRDLAVADLPAGVDRRTFMMRSAVVTAVAVITGCSTPSPEEVATKTPPAAPRPEIPLAPDLEVVKKTKGPVMTTLDEFYQRCTRLPADQLAKATALRVNLFGSLSATGKGHGTERAALAGLIGKEPATVEPAFLDGLRDKPDQSFPVKLGSSAFNVSLKDVVYDAAKGEFPHPNTMRV